MLICSGVNDATSAASAAVSIFTGGAAGATEREAIPGKTDGGDIDEGTGG